MAKTANKSNLTIAFEQAVGAARRAGLAADWRLETGSKTQGISYVLSNGTSRIRLGATRKEAEIALDGIKAAFEMIQTDTSNKV